jgi:hypothetical protein
LKVSTTARDTSLLRFGTPFTAEQCTWLLAHNNPQRYLRSWLLIGMQTGAGAWREFILLPAPATTVLLRSDATLARVYDTRGMRRCLEIDCVIEWLLTIGDGR